MTSKTGNTDFATTLAQLEALVARLEDENTSLEQSLSDFEQGIKLTREAQKALAAAEQKVQLLMEQNGELQADDFHQVGDGE